MRAHSLAFVAAAFLLLIPVQSCFAAMDYAKQVLIESDFSNRDLRGVTFNLTNLRRANLSGSDLAGASLFGAKLEESDLSNTNLREATLDSAVLDGTDLTNAVLVDAFAFNARFCNNIRHKLFSFPKIYKEFCTFFFAKFLSLSLT